MKFATFPVLIILSVLLMGCAPEAAIPPTVTPEPTPTATAIPTATADPNSWELVWSDEFDQPFGSAPDPKKWNHQKGGGG
jgi:hypothetical protein